MSDKYEALMEIGKSAAASIQEMVDALECDYDRLEELKGERMDWVTDADLPVTPAREEQWAIAYPVEAGELAELIAAAGECESREEAEQRIQEDALSIEVRTGWTTLETIAHHGLVAEEFCITLTTGGPAVRIIGDLDHHGQASRPRLEVQDWGTPWTEYRQIERSTLEAYCSCFYFGE